MIWKFQIHFLLMYLRKNYWNLLYKNQTFLRIFMMLERFKLPTRLRLGVSHLSEHKFRQLSRLCRRYAHLWSGYRTTTHLHFHCPCHHCTRKSLFQKIHQNSDNISEQSDSTITNILLFGNKISKQTKFYWCLQLRIEFILSTKRFSRKE